MRRLGHLAVLAIFLTLAVPGSLAQESAPPSSEVRFRYPSLYPEQHLEFEPGMTLTYLDHGEGFPVVFLHGLGADHHQWNGNMPALDGRFRILAIDFPGHGKSDRVSGYDYGIPKYTRALIALLDSRGIRKAVLVGNSMGGHVALHAAIHHPDRVERLVLIDSAGAGSLGEWKRSLAEFAFDYDLPRLLDPTLARILDGLVITRNQDGAVTEEMRAKIVDDTSSSAHRQLMMEVMGSSLDSIFEHDLSGELTHIEQRTLIVWGTNDKLIPVSHGLRLRCRIPRSKLVVYPGVGHVPSVEVPERFNRCMVEFLDDLAQGPIQIAKK